MRAGLLSGSFDPITVGHIDLIKRAAPLFDKLHVVIFDNGEKKCLFSLEDRMKMIKAASDELNLSGCEIVCDVYGGLVADYVKEKGITSIIRGARNGADFDYECMISTVNKTLNPDAETIIFPPKPEYLHVSSTVVREMIKFDKNLDFYIPAPALEIIKKIKK